MTTPLTKVADLPVMASASLMECGGIMTMLRIDRELENATAESILRGLSDCITMEAKNRGINL